MKPSTVKAGVQPAVEVGQLHVRVAALPPKQPKDQAAARGGGVGGGGGSGDGGGGARGGANGDAPLHVTRVANTVDMQWLRRHVHTINTTMSKVGDEIRLCGDALADMQVREKGRMKKERDNLY